MNKKLILASRSPRRSELLELARIPFICEPSDIEEVMDESLPLNERIQQLAYQKALPIFKKHPNDLVLGADSIVYIDNQVIGKPKDADDARRILKQLSGRTHQVTTGVAIVTEKEVELFSQTSDVVFYELSDDEIEDYIISNEWDGKAGGYAIQGYACRFIKEIKGDYSNIVGLPISMVYQSLKKLK